MHTSWPVLLAEIFVAMAAASLGLTSNFVAALFKRPEWLKQKHAVIAAIFLVIGAGFLAVMQGALTGNQITRPPAPRSSALSGSSPMSPTPHEWATQVEDACRKTTPALNPKLLSCGHTLNAIIH